MKKIALAVGVACLGMSGLTQADEAMQFNFSGFGTLGATYNNNHEADFRPTLVMPAGPGGEQGHRSGCRYQTGPARQCLFWSWPERGGAGGGRSAL